MDRELDTTPIGPRWLAIPEVASLVASAFAYGGNEKHAYDLLAWAIMPNHVHIVMKPKMHLAEIMRWLKNATGVRANRLLHRSGAAFWQREYFDHWIRTQEEPFGIIEYVERNPVAGGLVDWPWSSSPAARPPALLSLR
jgi:putative transposase